MSAVTVTFARCGRKDGHIFIGAEGTKRGVSFDSVQLLREAIKSAYERDREHQMLLALGSFLRANPVNPNPANLNGTTFTFDNGND